MSEEKNNELAELRTAAMETLKAKSTVDAKGTRSLTQSEFVAFASSHGVSRQLLDKVATLHDAVGQAAIQVTADDLEAKIAEAKKAGDDISGLKSESKITYPGGRAKFRVEAERTFHVPARYEDGVQVSEPGKKTYRGYVTADYKRSTSALPESLESSVTAQISKLF